MIRFLFQGPRSAGRSGPLRIFVLTTVLGIPLSAAPARPPNLPSAAMQELVAEGVIAGAVTLVAQAGRTMHLGATGFADVAKGSGGR